jgi:rare lipoprotein A (peptidoglycan hydrolase)
MTTTISQKHIARIIVFVVVTAIVMSISFLVQAHDTPEVSAAPAAAAATSEIMITPERVTMTEVADGLASWYGADFHGRRTASGKRYDMDAFTAAHKTLPFGTLLRVRNVETGKVALVEITDRGPFIRRRVVDLSRAAARYLGVSVTPVEVDALTLGDVETLITSKPDESIVLNDQFEPHTIPSAAVRVIEREPSLREAVTSLAVGEYLRLSRTERGTYTYERVAVPSVPARPLIAQK